MTLKELNEKWNKMLNEMYIIYPEFKKFIKHKQSKGDKYVTNNRRSRRVPKAE